MQNLNIKEKLKKIYKFIPGKKLLSCLIRYIFVPKNIHKYLRFWGWFTFDLEIHKAKMFNYCSDIESQIFWYGIKNGFEKNELKEWIKYVKTSKVIFDIGANTGVYSLVAKILNTNSKIYAFEPVPRIHKKMRRNFDKNNIEVRCEYYAISNKTATAILYDPMGENVTSVAVNKNLTGRDSGFEKLEINTITIDEYCDLNNIKKIDLIKIDVESHEPEVLEGYKKINLHKPVILCEVWNREIGEKIEKYVLTSHYDYFLLNGDKIEKVKDLKLDRFANYLFLPK